MLEIKVVVADEDHAAEDNDTAGGPCCVAHGRRVGVLRVVIIVSVAIVIVFVVAVAVMG